MFKKRTKVDDDALHKNLLNWLEMKGVVMQQSLAEDFADGTRYIQLLNLIKPGSVNIFDYKPTRITASRMLNWQQINKMVFKKNNNPLKYDTIHRIAKAQTGAIEAVLTQLMYDDLKEIQKWSKAAQTSKPAKTTANAVDVDAESSDSNAQCKHMQQRQKSTEFANKPEGPKLIKPKSTQHETADTKNCLQNNANDYKTCSYKRNLSNGLSRFGFEYKPTIKQTDATAKAQPSDCFQNSVHRASTDINKTAAVANKTKAIVIPRAQTFVNNKAKPPAKERCSIAKTVQNRQNAARTAHIEKLQHKRTAVPSTPSTAVMSREQLRVNMKEKIYNWRAKVGLSPRDEKSKAKKTPTANAQAAMSAKTPMPVPCDRNEEPKQQSMQPMQHLADTKESVQLIYAKEASTARNFHLQQIKIAEEKLAKQKQYGNKPLSKALQRQEIKLEVARMQLYKLLQQQPQPTAHAMQSSLSSSSITKATESEKAIDQNESESEEEQQLSQKFSQQTNTAIQLDNLEYEQPQDIGSKTILGTQNDHDKQITRSLPSNVDKAASKQSAQSVQSALKQQNLDGASETTSSSLAMPHNANSQMKTEFRHDAQQLLDKKSQEFTTPKGHNATAADNAPRILDWELQNGCNLVLKLKLPTLMPDIGFDETKSELGKRTYMLLREQQRRAHNAKMNKKLKNKMSKWQTNQDLITIPIPTQTQTNETVVMNKEMLLCKHFFSEMAKKDKLIEKLQKRISELEYYADKHGKQQTIIRAALASACHHIRQTMHFDKFCQQVENQKIRNYLLRQFDVKHSSASSSLANNVSSCNYSETSEEKSKSQQSTRNTVRSQHGMQQQPVAKSSLQLDRRSI